MNKARQGAITQNLLKFLVVWRRWNNDKGDLEVQLWVKTKGAAMVKQLNKVKQFLQESILHLKF